MMSSSIPELLTELPEKRRKDIKLIRNIIRKNMPKEIKEVRVGKQIVYALPLKFVSIQRNSTKVLN